MCRMIWHGFLLLVVAWRCFFILQCFRSVPFILYCKILQAGGVFKRDMH